MRKIILLVIICLGLSFSSADEHIIKSGDNLQITVLGTLDDLNAQVVVSPSGTIFTPWIGEISVAGRTFKDAEEEITKKLSRYFKNFYVSVNLVPPKPRFSILGEVQKPGMYDIFSPLTLLEAISLAGGLTEKASPEARVSKSNKEMLTINLNEILQEGKTEYNINIAPFDVIYLPEFTANKVTILGQVVKPGTYEIPPSKNVVDLIISAGGLIVPTAVTTTVSYPQRPGAYQISIRKKTLPPQNLYIDGATLFIIKSKEEKEVLLDADDTVYVREIKHSVVVLGEVMQPKIYEFKIGDRITDAIALAGGFGKEPRLKEIGLIRQTDKGPLFVKINMENVLKKGEPKENIELQDKDVIYVGKRTRRLDWNKIVDRITEVDTLRDILMKWDID